MSVSSRRVRGTATPRAKTIAARMAEARTKRTAAKLTGGKSLRPSLMNSQVEPHTAQRSSQTTRAFIAGFYTTTRAERQRGDARRDCRDARRPSAVERQQLFEAAVLDGQRVALALRCVAAVVRQQP